MKNMRPANRLLYVFTSFVVYSFVLTGCGVKSPSDYIKYVEGESSGYKVERSVDMWHYKVQYKPAEYIYLLENKNDSMSAEGLKKRVGELQKWRFFNVYVSNDSIKAAPIRLMCSNMNQYNSMLNFYLNNNRSNFFLNINSRKVPATVYNYENSYNLAPYDVFVIGFEVGLTPITSDDKIVLEYNDEVLKNGIVKFMFSGDVLNKRIEVKI